MSKYYTLLTTLGQAMVAEAIRQDSPIGLTEVAVGDAEYSPEAGQVALMSERARVAITEILADADNPAWLRITAVLPPDLGGWPIHEAGVFAENGNLFAVAKLDGTYKPVYSDGLVKEIALDIILEVSSAANINLVADPHTILATRDWVEKNFGAKVTGLQTLLSDHIKDKNNPHQTTPGQIGVYTKAEVDALLKAAVAEAVTKAADKPGTIKMWSGTLTEIESGWALCDGLNGRPDLRDCFIMGAGATYQVGAKGGSASHSHSLSGSVGARTLTVAQMPAHSHILHSLGTGSGNPFDDGSGARLYFADRATSVTGGGQSHDHSLSLSGGQASNLPPFYALAFIIKL